MATALGILLASSLASAGLVALWAVSSQRHWFLRTSGYLGAIAPLLAVPAIDPFFAFVVAGLVIAGGMALVRRRGRGDGVPIQESLTGVADASATDSRLRVRLSTLLLATTLVAATAAIFAKAPALNLGAWQSILAIGVAAGLATLLGAWAATAATWKRRVGAAIVNLLIALALGLVLAQLDWFAPAVIDIGYEWPPAAPDPTLSSFFPESEGGAIWALAIPCVIVVIFAATCLGRRAWRSVSDPGGALCRLALVALAVIVVAIAIPPVWALWQLLTPLPIPPNSAPTPNGYEGIASAGKQFSASVPIRDYTETSINRVAAEVRKFGDAYALAERSLAQPSQVPVDYLSLDIGTEIQGCRGLCRGLAARARVALSEGSVDDAIADMNRMLQLARATQAGGLAVDWLVGSAIESVTFSEIWNAREAFDEKQALEIAAILQGHDKSREPWEASVARERIWQDHSQGWFGRLVGALEDLTGGNATLAGISTSAVPRNNAEMRLLMCELGLRTVLARGGKLPDSLSDLPSDFLPRDLIDPFDEDGRPLHYEKTGKEYVVYSVGPNGVDDGGAQPDADDFSGFSALPQTGDFRLDVVFAPDPATTNAAAGTPSSENGESVDGE